MCRDELGKLHNIFIRYNFTCLVDGLEVDTLKINFEPQDEKNIQLTEGKWVEPELLRKTNNNCCVLHLHCIICAYLSKFYGTTHI